MILAVGAVLAVACSADGDGDEMNKKPEVVGTGGEEGEGTGGEGNDTGNGGQGNESQGTGGQGNDTGTGGQGNDTGTGGGGNTPGGGYGALATVNFTSGFIFDGAKFNTQQSQHPEGIQMSAAFVGTYQSNNAPVPPNGAAMTAAFVVHLAQYKILSVQQQSLTNASANLDPSVIVELDESIGAGAVSLPSEEAFLYLTDPSAGNCFAAIGVGSLQITNAVNTAAADGGQLSFTGSNIQLFHPSNTPGGDLTGEFPAGSVCPYK